MTRKRSNTEIAVLSAEAERRVRAGENRADVAASLGIPKSTVNDWARKGGWRQKDIFEANREERARIAHARIAAARERDAQAARQRQAAEAGLQRRLEALRPRTVSTDSTAPTAPTAASAAPQQQRHCAAKAPGEDEARNAEFLQWVESLVPRAALTDSPAPTAASAAQQQQHQHDNPPRPTRQNPNQVTFPA